MICVENWWKFSGRQISSSKIARYSIWPGSHAVAWTDFIWTAIWISNCEYILYVSLFFVWFGLEWIHGYGSLNVEWIKHRLCHLTTTHGNSNNNSGSINFINSNDTIRFNKCKLYDCFKDSKWHPILLSECERNSI